MLDRHGDDAPPPDALRPGTMLGRYEIRRLIGRGGMGSVYEAVHTDLKKRVALKMLLPSLAANADARTRFLREGEAASRIQHPHVVNVTDVGAEGSHIYLVMEYLEGEDLARLIARQGTLSVAQTADIMLPVAAAIHTAHEQGVVHRDLKPENIFLSISAFAKVHPKVLDFGISKVTGDRNTMVLTGTGATFGTMFYLPPEQLQGARQADAKSDQYALGTILYECVTGQRAFERENLYAVMKDIAEGNYVPPRARRPDLPATVEAIVTRAMALQPSMRFASVLELGAALLEFATANARIVWAPFFEGVGPVVGDPGPRTPAPFVAGGTLVLPPGSELARAGLTPSPRGKRTTAQSTFGHATGESRMPSGVVPNLRRSRAPVITVAAIAAAVAIGAMVMMPRENLTGWLSRFSSGSTLSTGTADPDRDRIDDRIDDRLGNRTGPAPSDKPPEKRTFRVEIETDPRAATLELDGRPVGAGALDQRLPLDGAEHVIVARAPGYRETTVRFTDRSPPHLLALDPITTATAIEATSGTEPNPRANNNASGNNDRSVAAALKAAKIRAGARIKKGGKRGRDLSSEFDRGSTKKRSGRAGVAGESGLMPNGAPIIE